MKEVYMRVFSGKVVIEVSTLVEQDEEKIMIQKAHEGLTSELFNEIELLFGVRGYMTGSIGAALVNVREAREGDIVLIKTLTEEAKRKADDVYNKDNRRIFEIE
jgi:hypothetical protein